MPELFLWSTLQCSHSRLFRALRCCPPAAWSLPSVEAPSFVRFLTYLYCVLSLSYFSHFAVSYFSYSAVTFFFLHKLICFLMCIFHFSVNSVVCCSLNSYTSILFVLHKCQNFFSVAHFGAAIVVFSACFGAALCCLKFTSCWSTYVRPLSHLFILGFVPFVFFSLRCPLFIILRCHLFLV